MTHTLKFITAFALSIGSIIFGSYVLSVLWSWFVVPIFPVVAINIPQAIGLNLVMNIMTSQRIVNDDSENEWWEPSLYNYTVGLISWGIGYIVTLFL